MAAQLFGNIKKNPSFKFVKIGDTVKGYVLDAKLMPEKDFTTQQTKFWHSEKKRVVFFEDIQPSDEPFVRAIQQIVIDIKQEDGSVVTLWAKAGVRKAIMDAVKVAGESGIETGGQIAVKFEAEENTGKGQPKKNYKALYVGPVSDE